MTVDSNYQTEHPATTSGKFTGFTPLDTGLLVVLGSLAVCIWAYTTLLVAVLCGLVLLVPLYRAEHGRLYRIVYRNYEGWKIRRRGNVIWQAETMPVGRFRRKPRIWKNLISSIGIGVLGVLHYKAGKSDAVVITGEGSDMSSLNLPEQAQSHMLYADMVKRVASVERKYAVGVSTIYRRRPPNGLAYETHEEYSIQPEVAFPAALFKEESEWTEHDYRMMALKAIELEDEVLRAEVASDTTMAVSLTVKHEPGLASALKGKGLVGRKVPRLVLSRIADSAVKGLKVFGAVGLKILDDYGIEDFIRDSWDVVGNDKYRREAALRRQLKASGDTTRDKAIYWPSRCIMAFKDYLVMDDTYHAVLRMTRSRQLLTVGEMRQLHSVDIPWVTITQVGEAINSRGEYRMFNVLLNLLDDSKEVFGFQSRGPRADRVQSNRQQRLADIDRSGFTQSYNIVAVVSAPDLDLLEEWTSEMSDHADYLGFSPERVTGEAYQLPAAFSGFTGINML